jgi:hypothetical protein
MKDLYTKKWIIENAIEIVKEYEKRILTIRGMHYRLVSLGMTNDTNHYARVIGAMTDARWDGIIPFDTFSDHDRFMIGETEYRSIPLEDKIKQAKQQVGAWMQNYERNKWENQYYYPEVLIEKKALQGLFETVCKGLKVTVGAGKGYASLTFLDDMASRMIEAEEEGYIPIILYFGDYDPSGEDIPRSIEENLKRLGVQNIEVQRIALMEQQVIEMKLPPAMVKKGDTRSAKWEGLGQVELDAIEPKMIQNMCREAIENLFDNDIFQELLIQEAEERIEFRKALKEYVSTL